MNHPLSHRLKAAREAIFPEITQRQIAKEFGVTASAVSLWEKGKAEPKLSVLVQLAQRYKVSTDWLLCVDESTRPRAKTSQSQEMHTVPVVASSALVRWQWSEVPEFLQTSVAYPPQTAAAMKVTSDALQASCPSGCYAVVSKAHVAEPGQIVLAGVGNSTEPVLRKYVREGGTDLLVADDTRYPSYRMEDGVTIIGVVTEITQRRWML